MEVGRGVEEFIDRPNEDLFVEARWRDRFSGTGDFEIFDTFYQPIIVASPDGVVSITPTNDGVEKFGVGTLNPIEKVHIVGHEYLDGDLILRSAQKYSLAPTSDRTLDRLSPTMSKWSFELNEDIDNAYIKDFVSALNDIAHSSLELNDNFERHFQ